MVQQLAALQSFHQIPHHFLFIGSYFFGMVCAEIGIEPGLDHSQFSPTDHLLLDPKRSKALMQVLEAAKQVAHPVIQSQTHLLSTLIAYPPGHMLHQDSNVERQLHLG